jgi:predicted membrane protein
MRGHTLAGIIIIVVGLSILFNFPVFNFLIAFVVLWVGVRILTGRGKFGNFGAESSGTINEGYLRRVLIFSAIKAKLKTENFEGMELVTIFGGGEVDAGAVSTKKTDIEIDLVSIFGGIKLRIPKGWKVVSEGAGVFGGFNNKTESSSKSGVTLHLKGAAIFGGVEVVN